MFSKKKTIFYEKPYLLFLFFNEEIFIRRSLLKSEAKDYVILEEDLLGASDYRYADHLSSCLDERIKSKLFNENSIQFLSDWGGEGYMNHFISSALNNEVLKIMSCIEYVKKVYQAKKIDGAVFIWPGNCSYKLYKTLKELEIIPENIKLHPLALIYLKAYSFLKVLYFFCKAILYVETTMIKASRSLSKESFSSDAILHFDDGFFEQDQNFSENKIFSLFSSMPLLLNEEEAKQNWENEAVNSGHKVFQLNKIVKTISKSQYFKSFYRIHSKFRLKIILLLIRNPEIAKDYYEALRKRVLWDIFYESCTTKTIFKAMIAPNLTSSIVHKKYGTETAFIYFSTTESEVKNRVRPEKASCNDYSHMIVDYVVSSKLSNKFIDSLECSVGEYINNGPIFRHICNEAKRNRLDHIKKLDVKEINKLVSFFDHSIGHIGVLNSDAYKLFLESILELSQKYPDITFLYKSKKKLDQINQMAGFDAVEIINQIRLKTNCYYVNDHGMSSLELIGISDLIVSAPISSVLYESLSAGKRTISFDPKSQYIDFDIPSQKFPKFSATSFNDLEELFSYWLYEVSDSEFRKYLKENLLPYIQIDNHISFIEEFKSN